MKIKTIEGLVDEHYDKLFDELCNLDGDDFDEILIEVRITNDGKTIRRSWKDREAMLTKNPLDKDDTR